MLCFLDLFYYCFAVSQSLLKCLVLIYPLKIDRNYVFLCVYSIGSCKVPGTQQMFKSIYCSIVPFPLIHAKIKSTEFRVDLRDGVSGEKTEAQRNGLAFHNCLHRGQQQRRAGISRCTVNPLLFLLLSIASAVN